MSAPEDVPALVIGAGPAGLMAAEALGAAGVKVLICEAKPTVARKFLMAGKSGLNLTKDEALEPFLERISADWLRPIVGAFGPEAVQDWARGLGQALFTGSSGRVFPVGMKASPLLRVWLGRLAAQGAEIRTRWRWEGLEGALFRFATPEGTRVVAPHATILALGGASWPRLGSDAAWVPWLEEKGVRVAPFRPANMGFCVNWSDPMRRHFGQPVKGCALSTGTETVRAEFVISTRGIEGGGIYALSAAVRDGAVLTLDLAPDRPLASLAERLARPRGRETLSNHLRKAAGLDAPRLALLQEWGRPLPDTPGALAALVKRLPVRHAGPRPLAEAISSTGGISRDSLTDDLELTALPGTFAAGEMLDWEAPTGGYLLTACLATGRHAGLAAARWLQI
ncbi:TIGR03862 family flavoprotein [Frigidibacter sp. RF13]|uniref:TIGR03862 family flavoprotein n=1 Tax=Frigidibacter sp. RF13 TaxID=2997340 RepID=UPI0022705A79|nr:TIGR03862 family flavoprotein [Frigidibacter sp. RF13]MCY1126548.1 TIGR03862 family flavoprotein [Frigidibacter sp. RF13]